MSSTGDLVKTTPHALGMQRPATTAPLRTTASQIGSILLNQPLDVLKVLSDHLPVETAAALSLTCKGALAVFKPKNLTEADQRAIRYAFEKEVSDRCYYCFCCGRYHRYCKTWRFCLLRKDARCGHPQQCEDLPVYPLFKFGIWIFSFLPFQLIMNEHFYGTGRGINRAVFQPLQTRDNSCQLQPTIAILGDQCFLSVRYKMDRWEMGERLPYIMFCRHNDNRGFDIGMVYPRKLPELEHPDRAWLRDDEHFQYDIQSHCPICLTDYTFKMSRRRPSMGLAEYRVEVVTYHQLGACRTLDDWMWKAFHTNHLERHPDLVTRQRYIDSAHKPGAIKDRWDSGLARGRRVEILETSENAG